MADLTPSLAHWLTLSQAAEQLSVHPTTLRRWADQGAIPVILTPGGHRRFAVDDLELFAATRRQRRLAHGLEEVWAEQAISRTRRDLVVHQDERWLATQEPEDLAENRRLGQRLMGLTMQYIALAEGGDDLLQEAQAIGRKYGRNARRLQMPLTDALQAAMFFRDTLVETAVQLPEAARIRPEDNLRLLRRINQLLNAVHLAIADIYETGRDGEDD